MKSRLKNVKQSLPKRIFFELDNFVYNDFIDFDDEENYTQENVSKYIKTEKKI
jgi:6-pyruvoyl-tetrahydropterin synthase